MTDPDLVKINTNFSKWQAWLLVAAFVACICGPLLVMPFQESQAVSKREKRRLATLPEPTVKTIMDSSYQFQFGRFFRDHFGLRGQFTGGAKWFRETFLNKSISKQVHLGVDDWLFFNIDSSVHDFTGYYTRSRAGFESVIRGLDIKQRWLEQAGIRYLLVPLPGKMSIYPEYLPPRIQNARGNTRLQLFREMLDGRPESRHVLNIQPALEQAKSNRQIYFKTDTHWNDHGAYVAYRETMEKLREWYPHIQPLLPEDLETRPKSKRGDIAIAAGSSGDFAEKATQLAVKQRCASEEYRKVKSFKKTDAYKLKKKRLPVANGCPGKDLKVLVVHDSFGVYLKQFMSETFGEVVFMHSYDVFGMKSYLEEFQPDIFIDFRVDRRFHMLFPEDANMLSELNN